MIAFLCGSLYHFSKCICVVWLITTVVAIVVFVVHSVTVVLAVHGIETAFYGADIAVLGLVHACSDHHTLVVVLDVC